MKLPEDVRSRARLRPGGPLRERVHPVVLAGLVVLWLLLWGDVSIANVLSGLLLALLVTVVLPLPPVELGVRLRPLRLVAFAARFVLDLVRASGQVAWLALRPGSQPQNSVVGVPLHSDSDLFTAMTAQVTSLVPGSVIVEVVPPTTTERGWEHGWMYVHALGAGTAAERERARRRVALAERAVVRTFAAPAAVAAYEERCRADGTDRRCQAPDPVETTP
ncbi:Na+/H+ antiporter subunit E [Kineococcus terrestris]|uniref:Na+/H+ antiporter subunit E n=1 Tax=Kineococcus terrestris TaxID=2044856 RepID=UPI0034DAD180